MQTARQISNVKFITNIPKPVVVFELAGHPAVVRNLQQALTDLQNSGRALNVTNVNDPRFRKACIDTVGATLNGDLKVFKAGDKYTVTAGHPDIATGIAKEGDTKIAEKDGVWVEGFLQIPLTMLERQMEMNANSYAEFMGNLLGGFGAFNTASAPQSTATNTFVPEEEAELETVEDVAIGKANKPK